MKNDPMDENGSRISPRRQFFGLRAGISIGIGGCSRAACSAPASPLARARQDARPSRRLPALPHFARRRSASSSCTSRRPVAARHVRLQAEAGEVPRHAAARLGPHGPARRADDGA